MCVCIYITPNAHRCWSTRCGGGTRSCGPSPRPPASSSALFPRKCALRSREMFDKHGMFDQIVYLFLKMASPARFLERIVSPEVHFDV